MKRPAVVFGLAALLFVAHSAARLAGWAEHTSAIAGMPATPSSLVLGPAFITLHLATVTIAPILTIAAMLDTLLVLRRRSRQP
jgi:hypothetical protein